MGTRSLATHEGAPSFAGNARRCGFTMSVRSATCAMALFIGMAAAQAQSTADSSASRKRTFATERGGVAFLVGTYSTSTTMPSLSAGGKGSSVIAWTLDSMFLSIEEESLNPVFGRYKGHGLLGFDAPTQQFVLSMFNNTGDHPTYHGTMTGDTLVVSTRIPSPRDTFDQKLLWYNDRGTVRLQVLNDGGRGFRLVLDQAYMRAAPTPR